jgi:hypothetical protein
VKTTGLAKYHPFYVSPNELVACPVELYSVPRAGHPASRRCSSLTYRQYAHSSRLAIRAPRSEACYTTRQDRPLVRSIPDEPRLTRSVRSGLRNPLRQAAPIPAVRATIRLVLKEDALAGVARPAHVVQGRAASDAEACVSRSHMVQQNCRCQRIRPTTRLLGGRGMS